MKIFKSIKWRLQIWYGLILVLVLAGFGFTAYQLERGRQLGRIDNELNHRFDFLIKALHAPPRERGQESFDRPPPDQFPDDAPDGQNFHPPQKFNLPPQAANLFDSSDPDNFFFIIEDQHEKEIARSQNVPKAEFGFDHFFDQANHIDNLPGNFAKPPPPASFNEQRVISRSLPSGETILVGCTIAPELSELKITALKLTVIGSVILFFGLAGGWWFVGRALRPISEISSTAAKISSGDLSQRISIAETENELGQLAAILNSTFARLETAFAQQKQFASDAAHELRTPVAVMLTQTQMTLGRERDAAGYKQTVEACQRAAQRMRKLIESLLELARFDAGQEVLKRLEFDFAKTISDSVEMVQTLAEEKNVKIISGLPPLKISGDPERLAQVVTNLLTNAIQHNKPAGEVRVRLAEESGLAVLTIADTGSGIAAEDLPRVFERFYRADKSRTGAGNSGLGLAICKAIVEAHGGTIEAASVSRAGATFSVRLPIKS